MAEHPTITAAEATAAISDRGYYLARVEAVDDYHDRPSAVEVVASPGETDGVSLSLAGIAFAGVEMTSQAARDAAAALVAAADYWDQADATRVAADDDTDEDAA